MPIEIKITDVSALKSDEIENLFTYLRSCVAPPHVETAQPEIEPSSEAVKKKRKKKNEQLPMPGLEQVYYASVPVSEEPNAPCHFEVHAMRTDDHPEVNTSEISFMATGNPGDVLTDLGNGKVGWAPSHSYVNSEISFDDLISFVLENTREKKITFDQVMEIVSRFNLVNINSLSEKPELIPDVYQAVKEVIDNC